MINEYNYTDFIHNKVSNYCKKHNLYNITKNHYTKKDNIKTIYAIGDIHGDKNAMIHILKELNIMTDDYKWNKNIKDTVIIQTGDIIDGYRPDITNNFVSNESWINGSFETIDLLFQLNNEAKKCNSYINLIIGNHEMSNIQIYNKYYNNNNSIEEIKNHLIYSIPYNDSNKYAEEYMNKLNDYIKYFICYYQSFVIVNNYIFCHAGLVKQYIDYIIQNFIDIESFNKESETNKINILNDILSGLMYFITNKNSLTEEDYNNYQNQINRINKNLSLSAQYMYKFYGNRNYTDITKDNINTQYMVKSNKKYYQIEEDYNDIKSYFNNILGMVVGHSVTKQQKIYMYNVNKQDKIIYLDTAISQAFHRITKTSKNENYYVLKISFKDYNSPIIEILIIPKYIF